MSKKIFFFILAVSALLMLIFFLLYFKSNSQSVSTFSSRLVPVRITTSIIKETSADKKIDAAYPVISGLNNDSAINQKIKGVVLSQIEQFNNEADEALPSGGKFDLPPSSFSIDYTTSTVSPKLISLHFTKSIYITGAAHPFGGNEVMNFEPSSLNDIKLEDLFRANSGYLVKISDIAKAKLTSDALKDDYYFDTSFAEMLADGASPKEENYKYFTIEKAGLRIFYDDGQVVPHVVGMLDVGIAFKELEEVLQSKKIKELME